MSDNQRYRKEFNKPRYFAVDSSTAIEVGDMLWLDTDDVKPASSFTWNTNIGTTQADFQPLFVGIAQDRHIANSGAGTVQVNTAGIHEFTCASATFELEGYIGPAKASGNALENQKVVTVATANLAIGKVATRATDATTTVTVDIVPGRIPGVALTTTDLNTWLGTKDTDALAEGATNKYATASSVGAAGAVMDSDFSPGEGIMRKTGAGTYTAHKTNLAAAVAPTANEDSGDGYSVGSLWLDTTADKGYVCVDSTVGAAVWIELGANATNVAAAGAQMRTTHTNVDKEFIASYTCIAGDDTAGYKDITTGFGSAPEFFTVQILRAGVDVTADAIITALGGGDAGKIRIADGGATYVMTAGDVIMLRACNII